MTTANRRIVSYADLRRAEKECEVDATVEVPIGFLLALRNGTDGRDKFAMAALPGVMNMVALDRHELHELGKPRIDAVDALARDAYRLADAMMKAREA